MVGYVTLEETAAYIEAHYTSNDALRLTWASLSEDDQSVLLLRSFEAIELLPFTGVKLSPQQIAQFPRRPAQSESVPNNVKYAQIENALSMASSDNSEDDALYNRLWKYGISSYSIGDLTERTSNGSWGHTGNATASGVVSSKALSLLSTFLSGGYHIGRRCIH